MIESVREQFLQGDISVAQLTNALNTEYSEFTLGEGISNESESNNNSDSTQDQEFTLVEERDGSIKRVYLDGTEEVIVNADGNRVADGTANTQTNNTTETPSVVDQNSDTIKNLYKDILDRDMQEGDGTFWQDQLDSGTSIQDITDAFYLSDEFQNNALQSSDPIEHLYNKMLGRGSDAEGKAFWDQQLANGSDLESIIEGFMNSDEYQAKNA